MSQAISLVLPLSHLSLSALHHKSTKEEGSQIQNSIQNRIRYKSRSKFGKICTERSFSSSSATRNHSRAYDHNPNSTSTPALTQDEDTKIEAGETHPSSAIAESKMATDEEYMAFLDKANEDPSAGVAKGQSSSSSGKVELKALDEGVAVPQVLKKATKDAFYVSDADEPFEPVGLKFKGDELPDEGMLYMVLSP